MKDISILRLRQVEEMVGLKKTAIYKLIAAGDFPRPVELANHRSVGWIKHEVQAWLERRVQARDAAPLRRRGRPRHAGSLPPA